MKNRRLLFVLINFGFIVGLYGQELKSDSITQSIIKFQLELNKEYLDSVTSPLLREDRIKFASHLFFPPNMACCVLANFYRTPKEKTFKMKTTTERQPEYIKYGYITFKLEGREYKLNLYQNIELSKKEAYKDYLFLPFTDLTNGKTTYAGGRFIDLKKPMGKKIIVDFNKAYNPYCAYNHKYSCPVPPPENFLNTEINAGIMLKE